MPGGIAASIFGAMSEAGRASSLPGMAPPAPTAPFRWMCGRFLRDALHDLPVAVSVAALAAGALPGVGGLVILTLAGGAYRIPPGQSRFRIADSGQRALRRSGAVRCHPIGVIGCPRGLRVDRPGALSARWISSQSRLVPANPDSIVDSLADARVTVTNATTWGAESGNRVGLSYDWEARSPVRSRYRAPV